MVCYAGLCITLMDVQYCRSRLLSVCAYRCLRQKIMRLITRMHLITRFSVYPRIIPLYAENASTRASKRYPSTWRHKKPNTAWKASYVATTCTSIFELPALLSSFLFVPIWGMCTTRIILCYFGDKRCEMVGHIPRIICSAMIAVFV